MPCKIWRGAVSRGYGQARRGKQIKYVHRLAWEETYGPIPSGMCVLHRCDIPLCREPTHLFLGTKRDNTNDMIAKGRWRRPGQGPLPRQESPTMTGMTATNGDKPDLLNSRTITVWLPAADIDYLNEVATAEKLIKPDGTPNRNGALRQILGFHRDIRTQLLEVERQDKLAKRRAHRLTKP